MKDLTVDFGEVVTGAGYQLFDANGLIGAVVTAGITSPVTGVYRAAGVDVSLAIGVFWTANDGAVSASEVFDPVITIPTPPSVSAIASGIRAEIAPELGRLDVAVSTRSNVNPDNTTLAAVSVAAGLIKERTDRIPTNPLTAGDIADPLATIIEDADYPVGSAGHLIGKLNVGTPEAPVIVIPAPPQDVSLCRVFAYLEKISNQPVAHAKIQIRLHTANPSSTERMLSGSPIVYMTDVQGRLCDADGNPFVDLQRNDNITPVGSYYSVTCRPLKMFGVKMVLADDTFDLLSLIQS